MITINKNGIKFKLHRDNDLQGGAWICDAKQGGLVGTAIVPDSAESSGKEAAMFAAECKLEAEQELHFSPTSPNWENSIESFLCRC